jgi:hypothetical protein
MILLILPGLVLRKPSRAREVYIYRNVFIGVAKSPPEA